jgi:hypothetical protein
MYHHQHKKFLDSCSVTLQCLYLDRALGGIAWLLLLVALHEGACTQ